MYIYPDEAKLSSPLIFDSHAHIDDNAFDGILDTIVPDMASNGVAGIVCCGCNEPSSKKTLEIAENYDIVYGAVGIHPEDVNKSSDTDFILNLISNKKCVAIGEIGLDLYWEKENRELQIEVFKKQIEIAKEFDLPVLVHDREAHADTLEILKKYKPKGVLHCFSGSVEMAHEILKLGMYIGVGGVITFKNAKKLPDVVKILPEDRILLETDCPYLSPEPLRGKLCHSGLITFTAQKVAEIKDTSTENILNLTLQNAKFLFNL